MINFVFESKSTRGLGYPGAHCRFVRDKSSESCETACYNYQLGDDFHKLTLKQLLPSQPPKSALTKRFQALRWLKVTMSKASRLFYPIRGANLITKCS